jgi:acyl-coenzyme A synthetase/AMP-(fatty) acid ligase
LDIITRHCINKDIIVHEKYFGTYKSSKTYNYKEFCLIIDKWKAILIEQYNAQPGQTIVLAAGPHVRYYALIFASAELGLTLVVDWPHAYSEFDIFHNNKITMYGKIDFVYSTKNLHDSAHPTYNHWDTQRNLEHVRHTIFDDDFDDFPAPTAERQEELSLMISANHNTVLVHTSSSGTTGPPKKIIFSHEKMYLMAKRCEHLYFTKNNSILHTTTMHHGASLGYHWLPGFMSGKDQFTFSGDPTTMSTIINNNKINQVFLYTTNELYGLLKIIPKVTHCLNIVTLFQITPEIVLLMKEKNINYIKSMFGDNTIGLAIFIKTTDQTTDLATYDTTNMGSILDDFYQIEIRDKRLWVSIPSLNQDWKTSNDQFEIINGEYYFQGRTDQYRINGEWIKLNDIEKVVHQLFGPNGANIVIDFENQQIYLAVWKAKNGAEQQLINYLNDYFKGKITLSYILRNEKYHEFLGSRKIDNSKIREVCRKKLKESSL